MRVLLFIIVLLLPLQDTARAEACSLPQPKSAAILTIKGQIQECNSGLEVHLDMAMLEALPKFTVKTDSPWEPSAVSYEGVLLRDIVDYVKASGTTLNISALNDYNAELAIADTKTIDVILAYKREGEYMPVREKGPLFVVFPFSDLPSLKTEGRFSQSVWQVNAIAVK